MFGCIPNRKQTREYLDAGKKPPLETLRENAVPWDSNEIPPISTWKSVKEKLETFNGVISKNWFERKVYRDNPGLLITSQGSIGSCAGVSLYDRCYQTTLINQVGMGSEQTIEPVNALVTWLISKGGLRAGGQSIASVLEYGREVGIYPSRLVGKYDSGSRYDSDWRKYDEAAKSRQMGFALIEEENGEQLSALDLVDSIIKCCRGGLSVEIGQSRAVRDGVQTNSDGVDVGVIGGSWSHATAFSGYKKVNGNDYVFWINSHGNIYKSNDGTPDYGCWFGRDELYRFVNCSFCDVAVITYAESPYGTVNSNLNPLEVKNR